MRQREWQRTMQTSRIKIYKLTNKIMKNPILKLSEVEQKLLSNAIKAELLVFDKMISMLLRQEQPEAVKPLMTQVKILQKLQAKVEGEKVDEE